MDVNEAAKKLWLHNILYQNQGKNFVNRIINRGVFPVLPNDDGSVSTHSMAWSSFDDGHLVYPTVIQTKQGKLKRLDDEAALKYAQKTGEYIRFDDPKQADWFSKNYKQFWNE